MKIEDLITHFSSGNTEDKINWIKSLDISDIKIMINFLNRNIFYIDSKEYYINICEEEYAKKITNHRDSIIDDLFNL